MSGDKGGTKAGQGRDIERDIRDMRDSQSRVATIM